MTTTVTPPKPRRAFDLSRFSLGDMVQCVSRVQMLQASCTSFAGAAESIVGFLHDNLVDATGKQAAVLSRLFKTHPYAHLSPELQALACEAMPGHEPTPGMRCLVLLATRGVRPEFNVPTQSRGHRVIPLPNVEFLRQAPMISRLTGQFGLTPEQIVAPDPELMRESELMQFNVFHVPEAKGSPYVPAQEGFVIPFGIRSVLGFGGSLPTGSVFAVILFLKEAVTAATADHFKPLALSVKSVLLEYDEDEIFRG